MNTIAIARRCALLAALVGASWATPARAQRPLFGYEPPHLKAQRLREEARAQRGPAYRFTREEPARGTRPAGAAASLADALEPATAEGFWGEPVPLDSVRPAAVQEELGQPILDGPLMESEIFVEDGMMLEGGVMHHGDSSYTACDGCAAGRHCQGRQCGGCFSCQGVLNWFEVFGGAHGFTGPINLGETASFGFDYGYNVGVPFTLLGARDLSAQMGLRLTHSNISSARSTPEERTQVFMTAGLFRRVDQGYQFGLVLDYLHDDWYQAPDLVQLRGEFAYLWNPAGELGFWFNAATQQSSVRATLTPPDQPPIDEFRTYEATDVYAFYLRRRFGPALTSTARFYTGFTGVNDGILGADFEMPFNPGWALQAGAAYLIPSEGQQAGGFEEESWNVFVGVVWRPRGFALGDYHRPLFRVADNGSFFVDRIQ